MDKNGAKFVEKGGAEYVLFVGGGRESPWAGGGKGKADVDRGYQPVPAKKKKIAPRGPNQKRESWKKKGSAILQIQKSLPLRRSREGEQTWCF